MRDRLDSEAIQRLLTTRRFGRPAQVYDRVRSTNDLARDLAEQEAAEGTTVIAVSQTAGRGRRGRAWGSPAGGLWMSVVVRPELSMDRWPLIGLAAAVAAAEAIAIITRLPVHLKWPNDLLLDERKLGGILVEAGSSYAVAGIGINANFHTEGLTPDMRAMATTLQAELGGPVDLVALACAVLGQFETHYDLLHHDPAAVLTHWRRRAVMLGRLVRVTGVEECEGTAVDVDERGALLVRTASGLRRILAGDVSLRPVGVAGA